MPSSALQQWETVRTAALDEVEQAHGAVGGTGRGRRYATLQVNHAYAVLLASQFQGFCRELHTECVSFIVANSQPVTMHQILQENLIIHRKLDRENATPSSVGADFNRLGISFWDEVKAHDSRTLRRMEMLKRLNTWRNAIAHQDFQKLGTSGALQLADVKAWRRACKGLARSFDAVMQSHLQRLIGLPPW